jgi:hypothetical protein
LKDIQENQMPEIALPAFHETAPVQLVLEISQDLARDLDRYKSFYKQAYGAEVPEAELVREMARRFMEADREFQAVKVGIAARSRSRRRPASTQPPEGAIK